MESEKKIDKKIVMLIDDEPAILRLYQNMFRVHGVEALIATSGEKGLQMIKEELPSCVVLDVRMPGMDGIEVLKIMRADPLCKDIPVVVLTNYSLDEYREVAQKLNVLDLLVKSDIDVREVVKRVKNFLSTGRYEKFEKQIQW